jgi:tRNA(Arg) A34 adenosine deaminase TadA
LEAGDLSSAEVIWNLLGNWIVQAQEQSPRIVALPVAAVLVDEQGRALSWGVNSAWDLRTQHAEVNLIHRWRRAGSPGRPAKLWVSRKSCKMCAGAIWDAFSGLEVFPQVAFLEPDEGSLARQTVLDVGTFEYRRARRP